MARLGAACLREGLSVDKSVGEDGTDGGVGLVEMEGVDVDEYGSGESDAGYMIQDNDMLGELKGGVLATRMMAWRATLEDVGEHPNLKSQLSTKSLRPLRSCLC